VAVLTWSALATFMIQPCIEVVVEHVCIHEWSPLLTNLLLSSTSFSTVRESVRDLINVFVIQFFVGLKHLLAERGRERGMGHEHSKLSEPKGSRRARFKERLRRHLHRRQSGNGSSANKPLTADNFAGIALLALLSVRTLLFFFFNLPFTIYLINAAASSSCYSVLQAEMEFKDKWIACVSLGEQTFRTSTSDRLSSSSHNHYLSILRRLFFLLIVCGLCIDFVLLSLVQHRQTRLELSEYSKLLLFQIKYFAEKVFQTMFLLYD